MSEYGEKTDFTDCNYPEVIRVVTGMFGEVMNYDAILAIVESYNGNLEYSIDAIMSIMKDSEANVNQSNSESRNETQILQNKNSENSIAYSQEPQQAPTSSYAAFAAKPTGAIPKVGRQKQRNKLPPENDPTWSDQLDNIILNNNKGYRILLLLRGAPGCGKSYLARRLVEKMIGPSENNYRDHIFSADDYFYVNGVYKFVRENLSEAHTWNKQRVATKVFEGFSPIIIDNTNIGIWEMEPYVRVAVSKGYLIETVEPLTAWFNKPYILFKKNTHNVPLMRIERMLENYQRNISGSDLIRFCNLSYPVDTMPPVLRNSPPYYPENLITLQEPKINLISQNSDNPTNNPLSPSHCTESTVVNLSNQGIENINDKYKVVEQELQKIENIEQEWDNGEQWEEISKTKIQSKERSSSADPKPPRTSKNMTNSHEKIWKSNDIEWQDWRNSYCSGSNEAERKIQSQPKEMIQMLKIEKGTCIENGDTNSIECKYRVVTGIPRDINFYYMPKEEKIPDQRMLDKSTLTNEQLLTEAYRCKNEEKHFTAYRKMFKTIPESDLREIFEKCCGDVNWAVEIVLDGVQNHEFAVDEADNASDTEEPNQELCECNAAYSVIPDILTANKPSLDDQTPINIHTDAQIQSHQKKVKKEKNMSESLMELKKQIEQNVVISDSHYSQHCLKIRNTRRGDVSNPDNNIKLQEESISEIKSEEQEIGQIENVKNECEYEEVNYSDNESVCSQEATENTVNVNVGAQFIIQLDEIYGRNDIKYPPNVLPVINMPVSMLNNINALWIESLTYQLDTQARYADILVKQDEEFARELADKEFELAKAGKEPEVPDFREIMDLDLALNLHKKDVAGWRNKEPNDLAARMSREKLYNLFPDIPQEFLSEVLMAHENNFQTTVEVLLTSTGQSAIMEQKNGINKFIMAKEMERQEKRLKEANEKAISEAEWPVLAATGPVTMEIVDQYREEAQDHLNSRNLLLQKAQESVRKGMTQVASYYSVAANFHKQKFEQANSMAASSLIKVHAEEQGNQTTLDLHNLFVQEAVQALDLFLDHHINYLRENPGVRNASLFFITGRGLHSPAGPRVKPAVRKRLRARGLTVFMLNPGLLTVGITARSKLTHEIEAI